MNTTPLSDVPPTAEQKAYGYLSLAIVTLQEGKPNDRSEYDRSFAICITELEKAKAILGAFLLGH